MTRAERIARNMKRDEDRIFVAMLKDKHPELYKMVQSPKEGLGSTIWLCLGLWVLSTAMIYSMSGLGMAFIISLGLGSLTFLLLAHLARRSIMRSRVLLEKVKERVPDA